MSPLDIQPFGTVIEYAKQHSLALGHLAFGKEDDASHSGDEVIYLLALVQPNGVHEWLVRLTAATNPTANVIPDDTIFTSTGLALRYAHTPATLDIEFIGPFVENPASSVRVETRRGRAIVSAESLLLGLDKYCKSALDIAARLKVAGIKDPVYYGGGGQLKPEAIESGRKAARAFGLTPAEERLAFSVYFALRSFYQAATEIPACRDVLEQVIQKPSFLSMATNLGLRADFNYGWHHVQALSAENYCLTTPVFLLPLHVTLNNTPAFRASLVVSSTRPPLRNCAGIVALVIEHPTDSHKRVVLRLLAGSVTKN